MSTAKPVRVVFIVKPNDHPALYRWIISIASRRVAHSVRERLDATIKRAAARKSPQSTNQPRPARRAPLPERPSPSPTLQLLDQADAADASPQPVGEQQGQRNSTDVINEMWETF